MSENKPVLDHMGRPTIMEFVPAPKVTISVEVTTAPEAVMLVIEPVKVRVFLDARETGDLASALVKAGTALRQYVTARSGPPQFSRQEVTIPRDGPAFRPPAPKRGATPRR